MDKEISIHGQDYLRITKREACKAHCAGKRVIAVNYNGAYFREVIARPLTRRGFYDYEKLEAWAKLGKLVYFVMKERRGE